MSFVPGEYSQNALVGAQINSGIDITDIAGTSFIGTSLIAGTNVSIVPTAPPSQSLIINASPGGGLLTAVNSAVDCGVNAVTVGTVVTLNPAISVGTGLTKTSLGGPNIRIDNTKTVTNSGVGSGIDTTVVGTNTELQLHLNPGVGIDINKSNLNSSQTITNTGVTQITGANAGNGIFIGGTPTAPLFTNTGIRTLTAGSPNVSITNGGTVYDKIISVQQGSSQVLLSIDVNVDPNYVAGTQGNGTQPFFTTGVPLTGINVANANYLRFTFTPLAQGSTSFPAPQYWFAITGKGTDVATFAPPQGYFIIGAPNTPFYFQGLVELIISKADGHFTNNTTTVQIYYTKPRYITFTNALQCYVNAPSVTVNVEAF